MSSTFSTSRCTRLIERLSFLGHVSRVQTEASKAEDLPDYSVDFPFVHQGDRPAHEATMKYFRFMRSDSISIRSIHLLPLGSPDCAVCIVADDTQSCPQPDLLADIVPLRWDIL